MTRKLCNVIRIQCEKGKFCCVWKLCYSLAEKRLCFIASFTHQVETNQNQLLNPGPVLLQLLHTSLLNPAVAALRLCLIGVKVYNWYGVMRYDEGQNYIDKYLCFV